jgi:hypothetical protein
VTKFPVRAPPLARITPVKEEIPSSALDLPSAENVADTHLRRTLRAISEFTNIGCGIELS